MGESLKDRLVVTNDTKHLIVVRDFVSRLIRASRLAREEENKVILAVDEAVTNIIEHGYRDGPGIVEVEVRVTTGKLVVQLRDHAPPFDPTSVPPPDLTRPLELRPLGGMGVYLTRELTDEIRHRSPEGWSNELTLIKRIPSRVTPER